MSGRLEALPPWTMMVIMMHGLILIFLINEIYFFENGSSSF
jgi:hypothetical protein